MNFIVKVVMCFFLCMSFVFGQDKSPYYLWTFDNENLLKDEKEGKLLGVNGCNLALAPSVNKNGVKAGTDCLMITNALFEKVSKEFTLSFLFKGSKFEFITFSEQSFAFAFDYPYFFIRTTVFNGKKTEVVKITLNLDGVGKQSYDYYNDGEWHHIALTASTKVGEIKLFVDGQSSDFFSRKIPVGDFVFGNYDAFKNTALIDEISFYKTLLSPEEINKQTSYVLRSNKLKISDSSTIDPLEFAPGYPSYTIQATDQLKQFPLPRFNKSHTLERNMPWLDIGYLHRELQSGEKGFGAVNPAKAVELSEEMAKNWNYYVEIPLLRQDAASAIRQYGNSNTLCGALVDFINRNTQYPWATILMHPQINPSHAGFESMRPYVLNQNLDVRYYLKDKSNKPVIYQNKKWLSPLMPMDIIEKDGLTNRYYLNTLMGLTKKPPALINENGEVFGHMRKEGLLIKDASVWNDYKRSGLNESQYSGWFQKRMDSIYRNAVLKGLDSLSTKFSYYNVSAFNGTFWPDYSKRRELNRWNEEKVYSTPDFYPRWPDNWNVAKGAFNGYGPIAEGRFKEINLGDKFFSPFVSAGWGEEEQNIRPAQWLGLLKAMVMLGADFFYVGYFNITGAGGKWPNGHGPNDPRGYIYQVAIPAYAQAIMSWVPELFTHGTLLNPREYRDKMYHFRIRGSGANELILVRQLGKRYLIFGSIQPNSNLVGNAPLSKHTTIELDGEQISFEIRRQGSMYVLDNSGVEPIFYQLDGWHQYEHPFFWAKNYKIESESFELGGSAKIFTEAESNKNFTNFTSFVRLLKGDKITTEAFLREPEKVRVEIKVRNKARILINNGKNSITIESKSDVWELHTTRLFDWDTGKRLSITTDNVIDIDWVKLYVD